MPVRRRGALLGALCAVAVVGAPAATDATPTFADSASVRSLVDPTGDVSDARADLTTSSMEVVDDALVMRSTVVDYTNPTGDGSWVSGVTGAAWEIDTDANSAVDLTVQLLNIQGTLFGSVYGLPPESYCPVTRSSDASTSSYTASIPISCLGGVTEIGWAAVMRYRTFDQTIHTDRAPNVGWAPRRIAPAVPGPVAVTPARLFDTRPAPVGATVDGRFVGGGRLGPRSLTVLQIAGRGNVPTGARAAVVTATAISPASPGYVSLIPCGAPVPETSTLNVAPGAVVSNSALAALSPEGTTCILTSTDVDLAIDVHGYVPEGGAPTPVGPARLLDTRSGAGGGASPAIGRVGARTVTVIPVAGHMGVDPSAVGVELNVIAVAPDEAGYLTVYPCGTAPPSTSNVNYPRGAVASNATYSGLGPDGTVCVFSTSATDLVVDVTGYVPDGADLVAVRPVRLADTRTDGDGTVDGASSRTGPVGAGTVYEVPVAGRGPVPAGVSTAIVTVTAVLPAEDGFLSVFPCGVDRPIVSQVSYVARSVQPGSVLTRVGPEGSVCVFSRASTDLLVDVVGYVAA